MTTVEIVYNVISLLIAVLATVAFTVYAKKALDDLKTKEADNEARESNDVTSELEKGGRTEVPGHPNPSSPASS